MASGALGAALPAAARPALKAKILALCLVAKEQFVSFLWGARSEKALSKTGVRREDSRERRVLDAHAQGRPRVPASGMAERESDGSVDPLRREPESYQARALVSVLLLERLERADCALVIGSCPGFLLPGGLLLCVALGVEQLFPGLCELLPGNLHLRFEHVALDPKLSEVVCFSFEMRGWVIVLGGRDTDFVDTRLSGWAVFARLARRSLVAKLCELTAGYELQR